MSDDLAQTLAPCRALLDTEGLELDEAMLAKLRRHIELVAEFNPVCSLVSAGDLAHVVDRHVVDSLSLAAIVRDLCAEGGAFLDIGSGGGFPAIPVAAIVQGIEIILIERSDRKCGFLRRAIGALQLANVRVVQGEFPRAALGIAPAAITARAVERPAAVLAPALQALAPSGTLLWQSPVAKGLTCDRFHVEPVLDAWTDQGLRRGPLHLFRRQSPA